MEPVSAQVCFFSSQRRVGEERMRGMIDADWVSEGIFYRDF